MERYAARFDAVEINSTFYRTHRPATWVRWRAAPPEAFRFAVKAPKVVTHAARLMSCDAAMAAFLDETSQLGDKRGPVLVQLPPSLVFEAATARTFFRQLRRRTLDGVACEPRHSSWFDAEADRMLADLGIARVAADPAPHPAAARPGGSLDLIYMRLHGSPRMYRSPYGAGALADLADQLSASTAAEAWCIFDNTASGAAAADALNLHGILQKLHD